jgi:hypothetical protein
MWATTGIYSTEGNVSEETVTICGVEVAFERSTPLEVGLLALEFWTRAGQSEADKLGDPHG